MHVFALLQKADGSLHATKHAGSVDFLSDLTDLCECLALIEDCEGQALASTNAPIQQ